MTAYKKKLQLLQQDFEDQRIRAAEQEKIKLAEIIKTLRDQIKDLKDANSTAQQPLQQQVKREPAAVRRPVARAQVPYDPQLVYFPEADTPYDPAMPGFYRSRGGPAGPPRPPACRARRRLSYGERFRDRDYDRYYDM